MPKRDVHLVFFLFDYYMREPVVHTMQIIVLFMPPTSKKLMGHIGFGLCVHLFDRLRTVHAMVSKFHIYGFLVEKYLTHFSYLPFWSYASLKKI